MPVRTLTLLLICLANPAFGAIDFDNAASASGGGSIAWNHTIGAAPHMGLLVYISTQPASADIVTDVTVGSIGMTRIGFCPSASAYFTTYVYWLGGVPAGTQQITVNTNPPFWFTNEISVSYSGVSQAPPSNLACNFTPAVGFAGQFAQTITTTVDNSWIVGFATAESNSLAASGSATTMRSTGSSGAGMDSGGPISPPGAATIAVHPFGTIDIGGLALELRPFVASPAGYVFIL